MLDIVTAVAFIAGVFFLPVGLYRLPNYIRKETWLPIDATIIWMSDIDEFTDAAGDRHYTFSFTYGFNVEDQDVRLDKEISFGDFDGQKASAWQKRHSVGSIYKTVYYQPGNPQNCIVEIPGQEDAPFGLWLITEGILWQALHIPWFFHVLLGLGSLIAYFYVWLSAASIIRKQLAVGNWVEQNCPEGGKHLWLEQDVSSKVELGPGQTHKCRKCRNLGAPWASG